MRTTLTYTLISLHLTPVTTLESIPKCFLVYTGTRFHQIYMKHQIAVLANESKPPRILWFPMFDMQKKQQENKTFRSWYKGISSLTNITCFMQIYHYQRSSNIRCLSLFYHFHTSRWPLPRRSHNCSLQSHHRDSCSPSIPRCCSLNSSPESHRTPAIDAAQSTQQPLETV